MDFIREKTCSKLSFIVPSFNNKIFEAYKFCIFYYINLIGCTQNKHDTYDKF